jgi:glycerol-3-phosphate dehydrogenase (NAD(P)+)
MNFCVVGAGAWGTAFSLHLARLGRAVSLAPRRADQAAALAVARENPDYLPGIQLPDGIRITADLASALEGADVVLVAAPVQSLAATGARIRAALGPSARSPLVISLAKGLELGTHRRPSEVLSAEIPAVEVGSLAGPSNAAEVARGLPAAMVLAFARGGADPAGLQAELSSATLRVYTGDDLPGVEFGGALKNIYAIASGCCQGLGLGDNANAALLTRALAEMVRVGSALGARPETFYGLSGFGDLAATCHGGWSRNREFGHRIGEGRAVAGLISGRRTVVEGYRTTESFTGLLSERGIDAPILRQVNAILFEGRRPADALAALMARDLKKET